MEKTDLRKQLRHLYRPSPKTIGEVQVPAFTFLMVDGHGDPNTSIAYAEAVKALFTVSYTAKFMVKKGPLQHDHAVMPLEGLWWADDLSAFQRDDRAGWQWTLMIMQPPLVVPLLDAAMAEAARRKALPAIGRLRIEEFEEGRCAQVLHVGPFTTEGPTIERLHAHVLSRSALRGKHHEIYLTDIRRAHSSRWKTVIRQPME